VVVVDWARRFGKGDGCGLGAEVTKAMTVVYWEWRRYSGGEGGFRVEVTTATAIVD
jgi:hypothetical protein